MNRTSKILVLSAALALALGACSSNNPPPAADGGAVADGGGNPSPPTLSTNLIDRMGRAGVNTALTNPFDILTGTTADNTKDAYNSSGDPSTWASSYAGSIAKSLAILDGIDRTCGNQLAAKGAVDGGVPADRYMPLAGVLADDQLYVNSASGTCAAYLAVEANATGALVNTDCGGRTPLYNSIDVTYSVLVAGALSGVSNGITADAEGGANATTFPFLGPAN